MTLLPFRPGYERRCGFDLRRYVQAISDAWRCGDEAEARRRVLYLYRQGAFSATLEEVHKAMMRTGERAMP